MYGGGFVPCVKNVFQFWLFFSELTDFIFSIWILRIFSDFKDKFLTHGTNPPPYGLTAPRQEVKLLTVPLLSSLILFSTVHLISVITLRLTLWTTSGLRRQLPQTAFTSTSFSLDTYCVYTPSWLLSATPLQLKLQLNVSHFGFLPEFTATSTSFSNYYSANFQHTAKRCVLPGNIWTNRGIHSWQI